MPLTSCLSPLARVLLVPELHDWLSLTPVCMKVLCNNQGSFMFRWWGPKDNKALLWNYWKRGFNLSGSRRATPALHAFVEWLIDHHSTRRFDFTVEVSAVLGFEHSWTGGNVTTMSAFLWLPTVCIASCIMKYLVIGLIHVDHLVSLHSPLCTRSATCQSHHRGAIGTTYLKAIAQLLMQHPGELFMPASCYSCN